MKKISTAAAKQTKNCEDQKLTIGLDLGDRSSWYCVLDGRGEVLLEQKVGTTPKAMKANALAGGDRLVTVGRVEEMSGIPHEPRRGWLKNGTMPGDFSKAARCGAKNRRGTPCQCPAMANGRCRLHGGLSTGPKTLAGIERIRRAVTKHGRYSQAAVAERQYARRLIKEFRVLQERMK